MKRFYEDTRKYLFHKQFFFFIRSEWECLDAKRQLFLDLRLLKVFPLLFKSLLQFLHILYIYIIRKALVKSPLSVQLLSFLRVSEVQRPLVHSCAEKWVWSWINLSGFYIEAWTWEQLQWGERGSLYVALTLFLSVKQSSVVCWMTWLFSLFISNSLSHSLTHSWLFSFCSTQA